MRPVTEFDGLTLRFKKEAGKNQPAENERCRDPADKPHVVG